MLPRYSISLAKLRLDSFPMSEFFFQVIQINKKKYKQEVKENSKINKRTLVKVTPSLEGGDVYTELRGESQFTALEC